MLSSWNVYDKREGERWMNKKKKGVGPGEKKWTGETLLLSQQRWHGEECKGGDTLYVQKHNLGEWGCED